MCIPWLCVGIVSWLEAKLFNAKLLEELIKNPNQVSQSQVSVSYHTLSILTLNTLYFREVFSAKIFMPI